MNVLKWKPNLTATEKEIKISSNLCIKIGDILMTTSRSKIIRNYD